MMRRYPNNQYTAPAVVTPIGVIKNPKDVRPKGYEYKGTVGLLLPQHRPSKVAKWTMEFLAQKKKSEAEDTYAESTQKQNDTTYVGPEIRSFFVAQRGIPSVKTETTPNFAPPDPNIIHTPGPPYRAPTVHDTVAVHPTRDAILTSSSAETERLVTGSTSSPFVLKTEIDVKGKGPATSTDWERSAHAATSPAGESSGSGGPVTELWRSETPVTYNPSHWEGYMVGSSSGTGKTAAMPSGSKTYRPKKKAPGPLRILVEHTDRRPHSADTIIRAPPTPQAVVFPRFDPRLRDTDRGYYERGLTRSDYPKQATKRRQSHAGLVEAPNSPRSEMIPTLDPRLRIADAGWINQGLDAPTAARKHRTYTEPSTRAMKKAKGPGYGVGPTAPANKRRK